MLTTIKLSPSNLTFLWHSCKKCFYNHYINKIRRPMAMPLVGKMSSLSEQWFLDKTTDSIDSNLPKGIVTKSQLSLSAEIETNEELSNKYLLSGKIDLLVEFEDGNFGIYDCKNSSGDSDKSWMYYTQLAAYKYCFEQMNLGNVSHLGLIYQIIDSFDKNENSDDVFYFKTSQKFVHVDIKMERFVKLLSDVIQCLESEIPPLSNKNCNYCSFAEKYNNFD